MRQNYAPAMWGSGAWKFMHLCALGFPLEPTNRDQQLYRSFFVTMAEVLPCDSCSENYSNHLRKHNIEEYLSGPDRLFEWTVIMRNEVQKILGEKLIDPSELKGKLEKENLGNIYNDPACDTACKITLFLTDIRSKKW